MAQTTQPHPEPRHHARRAEWRLRRPSPMAGAPACAPEQAQIVRALWPSIRDGRERVRPGPLPAVASFQRADNLRPGTCV
jgi:hypothetical protein